MDHAPIQQSLSCFLAKIVYSFDNSRSLHLTTQSIHIPTRHRNSENSTHYLQSTPVQTFESEMNKARDAHTIVAKTATDCYRWVSYETNLNGNGTGETSSAWIRGQHSTDRDDREIETKLKRETNRSLLFEGPA